MSDREIMQQALEALEEMGGGYSQNLIAALKERLAQPEQESERNKLAAWMMQRSYATGHGDTTEDLLKELEWQIAENWTNALVKGVEGEREACAKAAEEYMRECEGASFGIGEAIRARGQA